MANVIIVAGDTGTGKSSSFKNLNPDKSVIINVLGKELPWKGSRKQYNAEKKNIRKVTKSADIINSIKAKADDPDIENIIIDDIGFSMLEEFFEKANVPGFDKFSKMGSNMQSIIKYAKDQISPSKNVILCFHTEPSEKENALKIKLIGRMLDDKYNPLSIVTIALFTEVTFDEKKQPVFNFITNRTLNDDGNVIPAKSPFEMFNSVRIPNDMDYVIKCMNAYYNGEDVPELTK